MQPGGSGREAAPSLRTAAYSATRRLLERGREVLEERITVARSDGKTCFICDAKIYKDTLVIRVQVKVNAIIKTVTVEEEMHPHCASELRDLLDLRVGQAMKPRSR